MSRSDRHRRPAAKAAVLNADRMVLLLLNASLWSLVVLAGFALYT